MNVGAETSIGRVRQTNEDAFWTDKGPQLSAMVWEGIKRERWHQPWLEAIRRFPFQFEASLEEVKEAILRAHAKIAASILKWPCHAGHGHYHHHGPVPLGGGRGGRDCGACGDVRLLLC